MAKHYNLKVANMRKEQRFILYPYSGGVKIQLQSDKRAIEINLKNGAGFINRKNVNYPTFAHIYHDPVFVQLPNDILLEIQKYLWENDGADGSMGGAISYANEKLFSK